MSLFVKNIFSSFIFLIFFNSPLLAQGVAGIYNAVLLRAESDFFQFAKFTVRTATIGGELKISANVHVFFGTIESTEFLTYEYDDVAFDAITGRLIMKNDASDLSFMGVLSNGSISGDWSSVMVGHVGSFNAKKGEFPLAPENGILVEALSGLYRGSLTDENPTTSLPSRVTFSFVTTQDTTEENKPTLKITGNVRLYFSEFDSPTPEYEEISFSDIQFNFFNRYLSARTEKYGLTFKGTMTHDGSFSGFVFSNGAGTIGPVNLTKFM